MGGNGGVYKCKRKSIRNGATFQSGTRAQIYYISRAFRIIIHYMSVYNRENDCV